MTITPEGEIITPFLRSAFNYDKNKASRDSGLTCTDGTRTQQQFKEEVNINTIVERFGLTGQLPNNLRVPLEHEFLDVLDYQSALNRLKAADAAFLEMPANIRKQFDNDAGRFVHFVSDPANKDQVKAWGLAAPERPRQEPIEVRVIPDPSEPSKTA